MANDEALKVAVAPWRAQVDRALDALVAGWGEPAPLGEAMRYALLNGGKRIRPVMTLAACAAAGGDPVRAEASGAALECVHAYSLVHDDLPSMDNDLLRRGMPTVHVAWGEAIAILTGDALQAEAFAILGRAEGLDWATRGRLCAELAQAAGAMVAGQVRDIRVPEPTEAALRLLHAEKTGALFVAACRMGAISAGADDVVLARLTEYGRAVGEAFQVSDDLLDLLELGESGGAHEAEVNLASVLGVGRAVALVRREVGVARAALDGLPGDVSTLATLADWIGARAEAAERELAGS